MITKTISRGAPAATLTGTNDNYFDDCMKINKQWLEARLKVPLRWELFKD